MYSWLWEVSGSLSKLNTGSFISGGLARASTIELLDPQSIPKVRSGQTLRIIGQCLFLAAILAGYAALVFIIRKAGQRGKAREPLWWMLASSPSLVLRGAFGVVSAADWKFSYYIPSNVSRCTAALTVVWTLWSAPIRIVSRIPHGFYA